MQNASSTGRPGPGRKRTMPRDDSGALPDGVRGTTRDVTYTVSQDEHGDHPDPARPRPDGTGAPRPDTP